jgi:HAD superfamily phosphatase (TIGR01681 family)
MVNKFKVYKKCKKSKKLKITFNKYTNTDKELIDYKLFVFDLDHTLYLHDANEQYANEYHSKVKDMLNFLKNKDKLLYIATHNRSPEYYLDKINITLLFDDIIKETKCIYGGKIEDYTNKKDMILEILNKDCNKIYNINDVLFFDDHKYNITQVCNIGVKSISVDSLKGINFSEFLP